MAINPRTRQARPGHQRNWAAPLPAASTDPRRRPAVRSKQRHDRELATAWTATASPLRSVIEDFTQSWERGEHPRVERYLDLLPQEEDSAELVYHEYCLAEASDFGPDPAEYLRRFPTLADRLSRLFALHEILPSETLCEWAAPVDLPESGDEIGPYRLLRELGKGAFARVFLAEQADLDSRLVVLKVSTRSSAEPKLLSRARHPHIVEVLRHANANDGALHLVCMPFLGGATLASVLEVRRLTGRRPRSGRELLADLDRVAAPEYPQAELVRPAREVLACLSYPQGLAWIVARLAEALDHAYVRGVAHGDLKPSNILLTAEAVPLLLDMNLSTDWRGSDADGSSDAPTADLGGTFAYMAPERLLAIAGPLGLSNTVDRHRADLYALGLVLLEALTGKAPEVPTGPPRDVKLQTASLAESRKVLPRAIQGRGSRSIPPALRSILVKCLAPDPKDRYSRGNELAADLDRWRSDRPLTIADEPRRSSLARTARRSRFPIFAVGLTLAVAVSVASAASAFLMGSKREDALARYSMIVGRPDSGAFHFRQFGRWQNEDQSDPAEATARQLTRYHVLENSDWRNRDDVRTLPDREKGELEVWLLEQILRHAVALRQRPDSPDSWKRGLIILDRTLARTRSTPLFLERAKLLSQLGLPVTGLPVAGSRPALPWMDEYLSGVAAEPLHAREALNHYLGALNTRPDLFWASYRAANVACRIGEYDEAVDHLRHCVNRYPDNPALRLMLASVLCHAESAAARRPDGKPFADALVECDRAVALAPDYAMAFWIRAWVRKSAGWTEGVREDVNHHSLMTRRGGLAPSLGLAFELQFEIGPNYGRPPAALPTHLLKILDQAPHDQGPRTALGAVLAMQDLPVEATAEFNRVLDEEPGHLRARYQRAGQLLKFDRESAIAELAAVIDHPRYEEIFAEDPLAFRAVYHVADDLMNRGRTAEALEVAERGLVHVNRSRLLGNEAILARKMAGSQQQASPRGEMYYLKSRIHAAATSGADSHFDQIVDNLDRAIDKNTKFWTGWYPRDHVFDGIRPEIEGRFERLRVSR